MERQLERERELQLRTGVSYTQDVAPGAKQNIGEKLLKGMGWKGAGHGM